MAKSKEAKLRIEELYLKKKDKLEKRGETFSWRDFGYALGMDNLEGVNSSRSNISKMFKEEYNPSFRKLSEIAKALDVKIKDLIDE